MAKVTNISDYLFTQNDISEAIEKLSDDINENGLPERIIILVVRNDDPFVFCGSQTRDYTIPEVAFDMQRMLSGIYSDDFLTE